ncbi:MAG: hypothetical protein LBS19_09170 [Clostridiales bacterium]|jgi:hypothetical protein|nr:hypothetical protein [Clostridiales bacterium]
MKKSMVMIIIAAICVLPGCNKAEPKDAPSEPDNLPASAQLAQTGQAGKSNERSEGFVFRFNNTDIIMGGAADPIIEALGEPREVFEETSCAFDGIDRFLYYNDFQLNTFPLDGADYVWSVNFLTDSAETQEGLYVGSTLDKMLEIYGDGYERENEMYRYKKNGTELAVLTENGEVIQITYYWLDDSGANVVQ